jgi:hypothetical protein
MNGARYAQIVLTVLWVFGSAGTAVPQEETEPSADKSGYTLFNPTPAKLLREVSIDGPGATESPYTVDAGHFQIELSFVEFTSDKSDTAWSFATMLLKAGLRNNLDVELVLEPYSIVKESTEGGRMSSQGFGDTSLRFKYNLWGNDGGRTALALTPYVRFPTSGQNLGSRSVEGGLRGPFELELPGEVYLDVTSGFDFLKAKDGSGYHPEFINAISVYRHLLNRLGGYVEFFSAVSTHNTSEWTGTFDTGFIYELAEDMQLKGGVNIGVTSSADDLTVFIGAAWRY